MKKLVQEYNWDGLSNWLYEADEIPDHTLTTGAFCVVFVIEKGKRGRIQLIRHKQRGWELPGGTREQGESVLDCVLRELGEEGGISHTDKSLVHPIGFRRYENTTPRYFGGKDIIPESFLQYYLIISNQQPPYEINDPDGAIMEGHLFDLDEIKQKIKEDNASGRDESLWNTISFGLRKLEELGYEII